MLNSSGRNERRRRSLAGWVGMGGIGGIVGIGSENGEPVLTWRKCVGAEIVGLWVLVFGFGLGSGNVN